jgi:hypothetical protein
MTSPKRDQVHTRAWSGPQSECFALLVKNLLGGSLVCKASGTYRVECCVLLCHPWIPLLVSHAIAGGFPTLPHAISSETLSTGPSDVYRPYLSIKNGVACLCYICLRNMAKSKRRTILYENLDDVLDVGVLIYISIESSRGFPSTHHHRGCPYYDPMQDGGGFPTLPSLIFFFAKPRLVSPDKDLELNPSHLKLSIYIGTKTCDISR